MAKRMIISIYVFVSMVVFVSTAAGFEQEEHRAMAESSFVAVISECGSLGNSTFSLGQQSGNEIALDVRLISHLTFSALCAEFAANDRDASRFHIPHHTVMQQLQGVDAEMLRNQIASTNRMLFDIGESGRVKIVMSTPGASNVVASWFVRHYLALSLAAQAGRDAANRAELLRKAFIVEAGALGYYMDAFSSAHMLSHHSDIFAPLQSSNAKAAHDHYATEGLFVADASGNAWQAFGDRLMFWYGASYRHLKEACGVPLKELMLAYFASTPDPLPELLQQWADSIAGGKETAMLVNEWITPADGESFYSRVRLPSLLRLPMPIAATWSVRTDQLDQYGYYLRRHYPQLSDIGHHDPTLSADQLTDLPDRNAVPSWLVFDRLHNADPGELIRDDPDIASVRWSQNQYYPPSYKGLLVRLGGAMFFHDADLPTGLTFGIGHGLVDDAVVIRNVSADLILAPSFSAARRLLLMPGIGGGVPIGGPLPLKALHAELAYAFGLRQPHSENGLMLAVGLDAKPYRLGFTYAGLTVRLKYQWLWLNPTLHGPAVDIILQ